MAGVDERDRLGEPAAARWLEERQHGREIGLVLRLVGPFRLEEQDDFRAPEMVTAAPSATR
jgi:hypothetical protein